MNLFVSTAIGLEPLLQKELADLECVQVKPGRAGCYVEAELQQAYEICLWSRIASRVLIPIESAVADDGDDLYQIALGVNWRDWLSEGANIAIDFSGTNSAIRHTNFGALKIKDGIADWCRQNGWQTPRLAGDSATRISARLRKGKLELALDFSGAGLHKRGYREQFGEAPLRESLAAALLRYAGWPADKFGGNLLDPMCGSGTLLIEAGWAAVDRAPNLDRTDWGFMSWPSHEQELWQKVHEEAVQREKQGLASWSGNICGSDIDARAVHIAKRNIRAAGLDGVVTVEQRALAYLACNADSGLLISNPPYGERLQNKQEALGIYQLLGEQLRSKCQGWHAAVLAPDVSQGQAIGMHSHRNLSFSNGSLPCKLYLFEVEESRFLKPTKAAAPSEGAQMVANRITKNLARTKSWRLQNEIRAWRCYDLDLSEYAAAVDIYEAQAERYALVQEYVPPKTVDESLARHRLNELLTGVQLATGIAEENVLLRRRQRQKGSQQYEKQQAESTRECIVSEGNARFVVNLTDYLDTGLFLDHRPVRRYVNKNAGGKRFLNLFCYTASVSVQAALGGASESLSLDMSNTYLDWAERNYQLNKVDSERHRLERADCVQWLQGTTSDKLFDLILLDPPSFSNSKKMDDVLDVEKDQAALIRGSMRLLAPGGTLIFSTNRRGFKLDDAISSEFAVEDFHQASIDPDFERRPNIHQCWLIRHG
jgi:23S rRNA (guanine2445-N2)-methyltransferase / 23S rRNA (guanine2069-N7)-methyltransferase